MVGEFAHWCAGAIGCSTAALGLPRVGFREICPLSSLLHWWFLREVFQVAAAELPE